jgi:hypothetical protein
MKVLIKENEAFIKKIKDNIKIIINEVLIYKL